MGLSQYRDRVRDVPVRLKDQISYSQLEYRVCQKMVLCPDNKGREEEEKGSLLLLISVDSLY